MSGGSKSQVVGYWYRILGHYGLSKGPVDAFLELRGGDRTAWKGLLTSSGRIRVAAANLWGGKKSEGGLDGEMDLMFGEADQAPNDYLAAHLGEQSAYRGKFTAVWRGGRYGAMNPYPKTLSFKFRRILQGWDDDTPWYPEKAPIPLVPAEPMALYFSLDISGSMETVTPNGKTRLANMKSAIVAALQVISDVVLSTDAEVDVIVVGWGTQPSTRTSLTRRRCTKADITALQGFVNGLASGYWTYFPAGLLDMPAFFSGAPEGAKKMVFFCTDGEPSTSDSSMTSEQIAVAAGNLVKAQAGVSVYAMNIDLANTEFTEHVDNTPDDGVPVIAGDNPDAITNVIISGLGGLIGMNPIHILYDSLTARDMQGEPTGLINEASFRAAADKCFAEGLGLCTTYVPDEEDIEQFQQRICDVTGANLTQSRVDGQYYVDLIRGDFDFDSLPVLTSDDVLEFSQEPSNLNEVTNQISVTWFDPQGKQERTTPPIQSMGAIMAAGGVIAETKSYPEIPTEGLALRVGGRDLLAKATPLSRFEILANHRPWKWRPGNYFRLQLPEEGIADMVCIVGEIDTGTFVDGRCRLKAIQDVFAFPDTVYVQPESGLAEPENPNPTSAPHQVILEAPYIELLASLSNADMAAFPIDAGGLLTIATRPSNGLNYSLYTAAEGESLADSGTAEWCPSAAVVEEAGFLDTAFTLTDGNDLNNVELGTWALWGSEIVRVDALNYVAGTVTLGRGCADTPPTSHLAGERLFFCGDWVGTDGREYVDGETVSAKLLTRTESDEQSLESAQLLIVEMDQRQYRPYPPGRLRINGEAYPDEVSDLVTLSYAHRDRIMQADKIIDTEFGSVGPEAGVTYSARLLRADSGSVLDQKSLVTLGEISLSTRYQGMVTAELWSVRDGLPSFQRHVASFMHLVTQTLMQATVTVPSRGAALSGFPVYMDLASMPSEFWENRPFADGRDIRVKTMAGADLPFHLVRVNPGARTGALFVKVDLSASASTTFRIHWGDRSLAAVNGAAVWSDYHRVYLFHIDQADATGSGVSAGAYNRNKRFGLVSESPALTAHQGVCSDGSFYYVVDTNRISKYDLSWTLVASNANPVGDVGDGTNHCGDPDIHDGILYVPVQIYTSETVFSSQRVSLFRADTLAYVSSYDVSAQGAEVAGICIDADAGHLYTVSYTSAGFRAKKYSLATMEFIESIAGSATSTYVQGMTKFRGQFYANSDGQDYTYWMTGPFSSANR